MRSHFSTSSDSSSSSHSVYLINQNLLFTDRLHFVIFFFFLFLLYSPNPFAPIFFFSRSIPVAVTAILGKSQGNTHELFITIRYGLEAHSLTHTNTHARTLLALGARKWIDTHENIWTVLVGLRVVIHFVTPYTRWPCRLRGSNFSDIYQLISGRE